MDESQTTPAPTKVTVVVISHRSGRALSRCLAALAASEGRERMEIVVVDNGSFDTDAELESQYPDARFLRLPRNFGYTKAAAIGIRNVNTESEFVFLLAPEVEVLPATVNSLVERLEADPLVAGVCPLLVNPEGHPEPEAGFIPSRKSFGNAETHWGGYEPADLDLAAEAVEVECVSRTAFMARNFFLKGIRLDERLGEFWFDTELCIQIWKSSRKLLLLTGVRAVKHPKEPERPLSTQQRALLAADSLHGAATLVSKHYGLFRGVQFQLTIGLRLVGSALLSLVSFRGAGYQFRLLALVLSGQKIDGSQRGI